ncbi:MAG: DUF115 domain-containing protein [Thiotrichales bacterium]|nr:DUF115 domain-containing protein [Thiotrichales bacterium]
MTFNPSGDTHHIVVLIGTLDELNAELYTRIQSAESDNYLLIDTENAKTASRKLPAKLHRIGYQTDLQTTLLPFYELLEARELEAIVLSKQNALALDLMQQLPQVLEALRYFKLRADYPFYVKNAFLNVYDLNHPIIEFSDAYEGKTAVVLGAAPSLEKRLPWVKQHQEKLVIFAVARLAKKLLEEEIYPDFLVASDPTDASLAHAQDMERLQDKSILVAQHYTQPAMLERWGGSTLYWGPKWSQESKDFGQEKNVEVSGGTVANLAVVSALGMGCKTVYLAGFDFCFPSSGETHLKGSIESNQTHRYQQSEQVENYLGEICETTPEFKSAIEALPEQLQTLVQRYGLPNDFELWNLNPKAARIDGVKSVDITNLKLPSAHKPSIDDLQAKLSVESASIKTSIKRLLTELHPLQRKYRDIKQLCIKALSASSSYQSDEVLIQKYAKADKKLKKLTHSEDAFIQRVGFRFFTSLIQLAEQLEQEPDNQALTSQYFQTLFEAYRDSAEQLITIVQQSQEKGQFLLQELEADNDFEVLAKLWLQHDKPHRFLPWRLKHSTLATQAQQDAPASYNQLQTAIEEQQKRQQELSKSTFAYFTKNAHKIETVGG